MSDIITQLHQSIKARIQEHPMFQAPNPVNILTEMIGDLENEIEKQINEIGLSVVSMVPNWVKGEQFVQQAKITGVVGITEDVLINQGASGTQKANADIAAAVWTQLAGWSPSGIWTPFIIQSCTIVSNAPLLARELIWTTNTLLRAA